MYVICIFYAIDFSPPGITHDSLRSYRGLALREVDLGMQSLRSGDALTAFGGGLCYAGVAVERDIALSEASRLSHRPCLDASKATLSGSGRAELHLSYDI